MTIMAAWRNIGHVCVCIYVITNNNSNNNMAAAYVCKKKICMYGVNNMA